MNKEIKEILDRCTPFLFGDEVDKLTNCITNLQEENNKYVADNHTLVEMNIILSKRIDKANKKLESIRTFGLRSGKTLFSTLINESIDILQGSEENGNE